MCLSTAPIPGRQKNRFLLASRVSIQLFGRSGAARFFSASAVAVTEGRRSKCVKSSQLGIVPLNAPSPKCFFPDTTKGLQLCGKYKFLCVRNLTKSSFSYQNICCFHLKFSESVWIIFGFEKGSELVSQRFIDMSYETYFYWQ